MHFKLIFSSTIFAVFLISGCGETTETIIEKDKVIVLHNVNVTGCLLLETLGNTKLDEDDLIINTSYSSTDNNVSCATYGKVRGYIDSYDNIDANISAECVELSISDIQEALPDEDLSPFDSTTKACVLSFDLNVT